MNKNIKWETHPSGIGCWITTIEVNGKQFKLSIADTFVKVESDNSIVKLDAISLEHSTKLAFNIANLLSKI